ncbi:MAG: Grx4 family monothiol glutaredoxin [Acidiferrobacterales bacterium]
MTVEETIKQQIDSDKIVLYMKGTPQAPLCGFSARTTQLLQACGVTFTAIDVLADPHIREGIKQYSNWPTIPQLYVDGQFIGGCDIITELFQKGELQKIVSAAQS